jgi:hypothetical protein
MTEKDIEATRQKYITTLKPLFLPEDPVSNDIVNYFASLLRIVGMEDKGWDPYLESRAILEDLNAILQTDLPDAKFPDRDFTIWRMGLLMYSHIVEMDAPYEVITNLLRFSLGKGYSPNPFYDFLSAEQKKRYRRSGIYPKQKIEIIRKLSAEANLAVGEIFDDFYNGKLRNAISHSDYILIDEEFRCRGGSGAIGAFSIPLEELNEIITKSKVFISTFFGLEAAARRGWGGLKHKAVPYDPVYKGLLEILVSDDDLMCGFKVHWPNNSESVYRRTRDGIDMVNCMLDMKNARIECFVDLYARAPGQFSPLVEKDGAPLYTKLEGTGLAPEWENREKFKDVVD